jgi:hypothetical protein
MIQVNMMHGMRKEAARHIEGGLDHRMERVVDMRTGEVTPFMVMTPMLQLQPVEPSPSFHSLYPDIDLDDDDDLDTMSNEDMMDGLDADIESYEDKLDEDRPIDLGPDPDLWPTN